MSDWGGSEFCHDCVSRVRFLGGVVGVVILQGIRNLVCTGISFICSKLLFGGFVLCVAVFIISYFL